MSPADGEDNDCDGRVDEEVRNYADDDGDGLVDEDLAHQPLVITPPPLVTLTSCHNNTHPSHTGRPPITFVADKCRPIKTEHVDETVDEGCRRIVTRQWIATDACGNVANVSQQLMVEDRMPPELSIPSSTRATCRDLSRLGERNGAVPSDDCDPEGRSVTVSYQDELVDCTVTRLWRAHDRCGNSVLGGSQLIQLDIDPPDTRMPVDVTLPCTQQSDPIRTGRPVVTEKLICEWSALAVASVQYADYNVEMDTCERTIQRQWLVTDICGYKMNSTQAIKVVYQPPVVQFPSDTTATCEESSQVSIVGDASAGRSCNGVNISYSDQLDGSVIARSWVATDGCSSRLEHTQRIRLDEPVPHLVAPANVTVPCGASLSPNSSGWATVRDDLSPTCFQLGGKETIVSYSDPQALDECPRRVLRQWKMVTFTGHVVEVVQIIAVNAAPCVVSDMVPADGIDNDCDGSVDEEKRNFEDDDGDGRIDEDLITEPPQMIVPQALEVESCSIQLSTDVVGEAVVSKLADGCHPVNVTYHDVVSGGRCKMNVQRVWTAIDSCGNTVNKTQKITVVDRTPPVLTLDKMIATTCTKLDSGVVKGEPSVTDDCAGDEESIELSFGDTYGGCAVSRQWSATDACDNVSPTMILKIVVEIEPPEVTFPPDVQLYCNASRDPEMTGRPLVDERYLCASGPAVAATVTFEDREVRDDVCSTVVYRQWKVRDECGSVVSHSQRIILIKKGSPSVVFPVDTEAGCPDIFHPAMTGWPTVIGNCSAVNFTYVDVVKRCSVHRHWTVQGACGTVIKRNTQVIDFQYDVDVVVPKPTISAKCGTSLPYPGPMGGERKIVCGDLVVNGPKYSSHVVRHNSRSNCHREVVRRVSVRDSCRTAGNYMQTVRLVDDEPPEMDMPDNVSASCADVKIFQRVGQPMIRDNCSRSMLTYADVLVGRKIFREWLGQDECGNRCPTAVQEIELSEAAPVVRFPDNKTIYCDESIRTSNVGWPLVEKDLDESCFKLGGTDTDIQFRDQELVRGCPRTLIRHWSVKTFIGHDIQHDQQIELVARPRTGKLTS